jgi:hypothetical protein
MEWLMRNVMIASKERVLAGFAVASDFWLVRRTARQKTYCKCKCGSEKKSRFAKLDAGLPEMKSGWFWQMTCFLRLVMGEGGRQTREILRPLCRMAWHGSAGKCGC